MAVIHIRPRDSVTAPVGVPITLGMLAEVAADDEALEHRLRAEPVLPREQPAEGPVVVSALDLVRVIRQLSPGADIRPIGPDVTLVRSEIRQSPVTSVVLITLVCLTLFFGAMLAIMFFHADVEMETVHRSIHRLVTGVEVERPLWLSVPYSLGVGLGVLLFFNSLSRRRPSSDPSPLDVKMHTYDEDTDNYLISQNHPRPLPQKDQP